MMLNEFENNENTLTNHPIFYVITYDSITNHPIYYVLMILLHKIYVDYNNCFF